MDKRPYRNDACDDQCDLRRQPEQRLLQHTICLVQANKAGGHLPSQPLACFTHTLHQRLFRAAAHQEHSSCKVMAQCPTHLKDTGHAAPAFTECKTHRSSGLAPSGCRDAPLRAQQLVTCIPTSAAALWPQSCCGHQLTFLHRVHHILDRDEQTTGVL